MRARLDHDVVLRLALCLGALLLFSRCSLVASLRDSAPTATVEADQGAPAAAIIETATPEALPERVRGLLTLTPEDLGRLVLVLALIVVLVALLILSILLIARARGRRGAGVETLTVVPSAPAPAPAQAATRELGPGAAGAAPAARLVLPAKGEAVDAARVIPLPAAGLKIGRAPDNDWVIDESMPGAESVSRQHARIIYEGGLWILEDVASQNGVYVNGRRTGRNLLQDGWTLAIGGVQAVFYVGDEEVAP